MVLVYEDDQLQEHVIYYLICALLGPELRYLHVEKLALEYFHAVLGALDITLYYER
jgi:hypothetical protein